MNSNLTRRTFLHLGAAAAGTVLTGRRALAQGGLELVRGGRSPYTIVRPSAASPSQIYAAEELQRFIAEMSGATLPLATDEAPLPAQAILLGNTRHTAAALGATPDLAPLGDDGFRLVSRGPHLVVLGSPVRGTLYGVYELLEKYGGCRWYASFHTVIPNRRDWSLPALDETQVPAFVMREPFWWDMFVGDHAARCRANGNRPQLTEKHGGKIAFGAKAFVHTFNRLVPPSEFFADHPEYFSEINGQRVGEHSQLCLTNPAVVDLLTERLLGWIAEDPTAKLWSVSQNDWGGYCTCADCRAIDAREGSPSGTMIQFVNQVAERVEQQYPDIWIETLAYQYTRHPPKTLRPRANVVPRLCTIECDFSLPLEVSPFEQNVRFVEDIEGWSALTDKLYIWDYTTNFGHYVSPHPNFNALQGNARFFRDNHVVGLFEQGAYQAPAAEFAELRAWVLAKLLWDPEADLDALYDDYFPGYYGAAAEPVRTYFEELQAVSAPPANILRIWNPPTDPMYTDTFYERAAMLWDEAERRVADDPATLQRVQFGAMPVLYGRLWRYPKFEVERVLDGDTLRPANAPADYVALATTFLQRIEESKALLCEGRETHAQRLAEIREKSVGEPLTRLTAGAVSIGLAPTLGSGLLSLKSQGTEYLSPTSGGLDLVETSRELSQPMDRSIGVVEQDDESVLLRRDTRQSTRTERRLSLANDGVAVRNVWLNQRTEPWTLTPGVRAVLDLGDADQLAVDAGDGWRPLPVAADEISAVHSFPAPLPTALTIASGKTGRGVRLTLPEGFGRLALMPDVARGTVALLAGGNDLTLAAGDQTEWVLTLTPLATVTGLPEMTPPAHHEANRLVVEDLFLPINNPRWGGWAEDPEAEDGFAIELHRTSYEWALQWRIQPDLFEAGQRYTARARIRIPTTGQPGQALWAGIYDVARKKGWGQIEVAAAEVKPGYQWYELGTWQPEAEQYVWLGVGQFDKALGQNPAVEAVYVDRLEFLRQD